MEFTSSQKAGQEVFPKLGKPKLYKVTGNQKVGGEFKAYILQLKIQRVTAKITEAWIGQQGKETNSVKLANIRIQIGEKLGLGASDHRLPKGPGVVSAQDSYAAVKSLKRKEGSSPADTRKQPVEFNKACQEVREMGVQLIRNLAKGEQMPKQALGVQGGSGPCPFQIDINLP